MPVKPSITDLQPAEWPRQSLGSCFTVQPVAPGFGNVDQNSLLLAIDKKSGEMAVLLSSDQAPDLPASHCFSLTGLGPMLPGYGAILLGSASVRSAIQSMSKQVVIHCSPLFTLASELKQLVVAVPPMEDQQQICKDVNVSSGFLDEHVLLMEKKLNTLKRLSRGIEQELLIGNFDRREALMAVRRGLLPLEEPDGAPTPASRAPSPR